MIETTGDIASPLPKTPWGVWATLAWTLGAAIVAVVSQSAAAGLYLLWWKSPHPGQPIGLADIATNGPLLAFSILLSAPLVLAYIALAVRFSGVPLADYLAIRFPRWRDMGIGLAALAAVLLLASVAAEAFDEETPAFISETYRSADSAGGLVLLVLSFVLLGPMQEEALFRGFIYRGLAQGLGAAPAILVTSAAWSIIHVQYQWFFVGEIFALGLAFGYLRWRSGSLVLTFLLHALVNGLAVMEAALESGGS